MSRKYRKISGKTCLMELELAVARELGVPIFVVEPVCRRSSSRNKVTVVYAESYSVNLSDYDGVGVTKENQK